MHSLLRKPAIEIIALIARGEASAAEVVQAHLDEIARVDPLLHAFVDIRADAVLDEAHAQDEAAAHGIPRGPLGGLPVTVKSAIDVAGLRCETGSPSRQGIIATADAVVVDRLRRAGALILGTTNVANMLMAYETENPLHGRTANPWALDRTPGGSSGGEAAAIAAGCSAAGIGSDGGGSIRVPAHFSGICGLKPTPGRIPSTGHQPACLGPFSLIGVVGPLARTVADLNAIFSAIAGPDLVDPMAAPIAPPTRTVSPGTRPRIGFFEDDGNVPVTRETRAAVMRAAGAAAAAGYDVVPFRPLGLERARELWDVFFAELGALLIGQTLNGAEWDLPILQEYARTRKKTTDMTALDLVSGWIDRDLVRADLLRQMETCPVLLCPVTAAAAFRHGERSWTIDDRDVSYLDAMSYTQWFNILGNPAAVVPVGRSPEGLPIGVQIVGPPYEEETVLAVAAVIEAECGGYRPPAFAPAST